MPQVPRLQRTVTEIRPTPVVERNINVPDEAFGGGAALAPLKAAKGFASQAVEMAQKAKDEADQLATTDNWKQAIEAKQKLESEAVKRKGKDSFGVIDDYGPQYQKILDDIEANAANGAQRRAFQKIRAQNELDFNNSLKKHMEVERVRYDNEVTKASIDTASDEAVANYKDPSRVKDAIETQKFFINKNAERNGLDPKVVKDQIRDQVSKTQSMVVSRMLANNEDLAAKNYFNKNKKDFNSEDTIRIEKSIKDGSTRGESQRQATAIMARGGSLREALDEARKIEDPDVQDATVREIKLRFSENDQIREQANEQRMQFTMLQAEQTKELPEPALFSAMSKQEQDAVSAIVEQSRTGVKPQTDIEQYYKLKGMAMNPSSQNDFAKENLYLYKHKLGIAEFNELNELQAGIRKGDPKTKQQLDGVRTDAQIITDSLRSAGIDPNAKAGTDEAKQAALFRRRVDELVVEHQNRTGKKVTNEELQRITDNEMVTVITDKGWIWNTTKKKFELDPGEAFQVDVSDIPRSEKQRIEEALRRRGIPVTDEKVLQLYQVKIKGK